MKLSIKHRLLILLLSFTIIVWGVISVNSYYDTRHHLEELFDAQLSQSAHVLLQLSSHELYEQLAYISEIPSSEQTVEHSGLSPIPIQIHKYEQHIKYQIWINNYHLAVRTKDAPNTPLTILNDTFTDYEHKGQLWRVYAVSNSENTLQVQVAGDYSERDKLTNAIAIRLLMSLGLSLPLLAMLILVGVGKSFAPLEKIAHEMEKRKFDNLQAIDTENVPTEARAMITALNHLFEKLEKAFDNITRFTADAAHELRTPLAALKVNAQVALREKNDELRNQALNKVIAGVDHATNIAEQLLILSRLDPDSSVIKNEKPDLSLIAEESIAELTPTALAKNIDISLHAMQQAYVNGKLGMLHILLRNLVENAIQYTPDDGIVEVSITQQNDKILLTIADSGPGITLEEREDVFKRFYRGASGENIPGTGLGLSIVGRIIEIHQASIQLGHSKYNGLQVDILLTPATMKMAENTGDTLSATG